MPKFYNKAILFVMCFIAFINITYFFYTQPNSSGQRSYQATEYQARYVSGAIQPLPTISYIDTDWLMLGEALFNSTLLSADNTVSCASCHQVNSGGDDGFPLSMGVYNQIGTRNSPTVLNASLNFRQFWDGRSHSIIDQVKLPIHNPVEMGSNFSEVILKLKNTDVFNRMFNKLDKDGVTERNIIKALVTYEESLITHGAAIDRYLLGQKDALTAQQKRGLNKFKELGCVTCHQGQNIGGNLYQKLGRLDKAPEHLLQDKGRYNVTALERDMHVFKVPSLRNIALTAPYFHDGSIATLPEAVKLMGQMQLGVVLADQDIDDIVALLNAFTGHVKVQDVSE